jgi:Tol biopolymer transport system component
MSNVLRNSIVLLLLSFLFIFIAALFPENKPAYSFRWIDADSLIVPGEMHFRNMKMLTADGDNAEAYFSFDNSKVVFQSTRDQYECDQIFIMDISGANTKLVSTGKGRTTCAYWMPDNRSLLFASTHKANEFCPHKPDMSKGYVWGVYDSYDIFVADESGNIINQLTETAGYDAEATVSPKGDRIIFTSVRDGDLDLYSMKTDGSDVQRLTEETGYDGGANYSYDGKKIVWRAHYPQDEQQIAEYKKLLSEGWVRPHTLELFIMNSDGRGKKQLTSNGKANFAPYFFPDNNRIIFCSNMDDPKGRLFDLYSISIDGSNIEKITYNESFDGFPMFSFDGKKFIFCSNRNNLKPNQTNVFVCDWVE